jgi:hypothetical protein
MDAAAACSADGAAAIRYGIDIGADRVANFAGDTHRPHGLKRFLLARRYTTDIDIFYAEDLPRDRVHAEHLAGVAGVCLHPVTGCDDHALVRWLAVHGDLRAMLKGLLAPGSQ